MVTSRMRVIYMGTPAFAVPALDRLAQRDDVEVALVVTQPDRPAGRGRKLAPPPVKEAAGRLGLPVLQVSTLRDPDTRRRIADVAPDVVVVAAFGMILGKWILDLPVYGCLNLHASLLPKYRGANPIAAAIAEGERETGVTLMRMDRGLDTGPILASSGITISSSDTTESLTESLADLAAELLDRSLTEVVSGALMPQEQPAGATMTRPMTKNDGWLDLSRPAIGLESHVRAMWPWPRAWTTLEDGERLQVHAADVEQHVNLGPGAVRHADGRVLVGTGDGALALKRILLPGARPIEGAAISQSRALADGVVLGEVGRPEGLSPLVIPVETDS